MFAALPSITTQLAKFSGKDVYNADESGIYFWMGSNCMVAELMLAVRKKDNKYLTVLACQFY